MEALFIYFAPGVGHTHEFIDLTPVMTDGASEADAIDWAYEKYGNGREVFTVDAGEHAYLEERLNNVFWYAK